jgi:hypothetical protein
MGATMKLLLFVVVLSFVTLRSSSAQEGRLRRGDPLPTEGTGRLTITPMPGQIPRSLKELCDASSLIIDATVKATNPPRETSPGFLETDAVIVINRTLKGGALVGQQVAISQGGGTAGGRVITPTQYALVRAGEHYILFLTNDKRPNIPPVPGMNRYLVTGIWSGLFRFEDGIMRVGTGAHDFLRSKYEGVSLEQIITEITALLRP